MVISGVFASKSSWRRTRWARLVLRGERSSCHFEALTNLRAALSRRRAFAWSTRTRSTTSRLYFAITWKRS